jgi:tRNA(adenine34) deaminase
MQKALTQAKKALAAREVPIGAIIVDEQNNVISRGYNKIEKTGCQTGHAEVQAIQKACRKIGDWRLDNCWIYATLEPCLMCFGLIKLCRLKGLVFGATSLLFGYRKQKNKNLSSWSTNLIVKSDVEKEECTKIVQGFFKTIREEERGKL